MIRKRNRARLARGCSGTGVASPLAKACFAPGTALRGRTGSSLTRSGGPPDAGARRRSRPHRGNSLFRLRRGRERAASPIPGAWNAWSDQLAATVVLVNSSTDRTLASDEIDDGQTNRITPGVDRLFEQMLEVRAEARAGPARRCGLRPGVPRRPARRRRSARSSSWPFACDDRQAPRRGRPGSGPLPSRRSPGARPPGAELGEVGGEGCILVPPAGEPSAEPAERPAVRPAGVSGPAGRQRLQPLPAVRLRAPRLLRTRRGPPRRPPPREPSRDAVRRPRTAAVNRCG